MGILEIFLMCFALFLVVSAILLIVLDNKNAEPGNAFAWLAIIMLFPILGALLYFVFGFSWRRGKSANRNRQKFIDDLIPKLSLEVREFLKSHSSTEYLDMIDHDYKDVAKLLNNRSGVAVYHGSDIKTMTNGQEMFDSLLEDFRNAKHSIHLEYFQFRKDKNSRAIREVLMQKAQEGVKVRMIYDNIVNIDIFPSYYMKMKDSGVEVKPFTGPFLSSVRRSLNNRNHRKISIIDGKIGYIGGMNLSGQTVHWKDLHLRIQGKGVYGIQLAFLEMWHGSGGTLPDDIKSYFPLMNNKITHNLMQIVPDFPDAEYPFYLLSVVKAMQNAKKYVYIHTPYFVPTDYYKKALKSAVLSGVDVRVMVSHHTDFYIMDYTTQASYKEMLDAGVRIFEQQGYFNHGKYLVMDDYFSVVGTSNTNYRSFDVNFEINSFMYDKEMALRVKEIYEEDITKRCKEITLEEWNRRPLWKKIVQSIFRFISPLM